MRETAAAALPDLRVNPDARAHRVDLGEGAHCLVLDDFLLDPVAARDWACARRDRFQAQHDAYPGQVLPLDDSAAAPLRSALARRLARDFHVMRGGWNLQAQFALTTLQPSAFSWIQRLPHADPRRDPARRNLATVLYLFEDPELGGTAFFRWRDPGFWADFSRRHRQDPATSETELHERFELYRRAPAYPSGSNDVVEERARVRARFNRLVAYSGEVLHSACIDQPERLASDPASGRLTLNGFADVRPAR